MLHKVRTRMLSIVITVTMLMSLIPITASADGDGTIPTEGGELSSGTYQLTGDVTLPAPLTVAKGAKVTIDLNGHGISYNAGSDVGDSKKCCLIENSGTLTIKDTGNSGKMELLCSSYGDPSTYSAIIFNNSGTLTVEGGTLSAKTNANRPTRGIYSIGTLNMTGGSVEVVRDTPADGRSSSVNTHGIYAYQPVNITGGSITVDNDKGDTYGVEILSGTGRIDAPAIISVNTQKSGNSPAYVAKSCTITGGTFTGSTLSGCTVTGGTFSFDPTDFLADPEAYSAEEDQTNHKWEVKPVENPPQRVQNTTTGETYSNLKAAVDEANEGDALLLMEDCDVHNQQVKITKGITIDLKGHNITSSSGIGNVLLVSGGATDHPVVITDSAATSTSSGTITSPGGVSISGSSVVTFKNVEIIGRDQCITLQDFSRPTVILEGVSLTAKNSGGLAYGVNANGGYGGTIDVYDSIVRESKLNVAGSTAKAFYTFSSGGTVITLHGGIYSVDPVEDSSGPVNIINGYTCKQQSDGWHIVPSGTVATVGEVSFSSLQSALNAAAGNGQPVELLENVTSGTAITLTADTTIHANGNSITITAEPAVIAAKGVQIPEALGEFEASSVLSDGRIAYYTQYGNAIAENDNVTLLKDLIIAAPINSLKDLTIDLNGHDITRNGDDVAAFSFTNITGGTADVQIINTASKTGTIRGNVEVSCGSNTAKYSLTIGKNVAVTGVAPLTLWGNDNSGCITVDVYGTLTSTEEAAIQGNGTGGQGGTVTNIHDGAVVDGGNSVGIYHPQAGILNISGGEVKGATALYMRSGTLNITGGKLTANGAEANHDSIDEQSGYVSTGDALVVDSSNYPGGAPVVNITDGEFISEQAKPVASYTTKQAEPVTGFVKGGNFSKSLDTSLLDANLKYELNDAQDNLNAPFSYYSTIQAAADAAKGHSSAVIQTTEAADAGSTSTYMVTFKDGARGTQYSLSAKSGETITLPTPTRSGYTLLGWYEGSTKVGSGGASYQVTKSVTLEAKWTLTPTTPDTPSGGSSSSDNDDGYSVSIPSSSSIRGGSITVSPRSAEKGDEVTITLKPDSGYELDELLVTDGSGRSLKLTQESANRYTFTMPASRVDIEVSFKLVESATVNPFVDVSKRDYYYDAVLWAVENGVTSGTSATTFGPNVTVTRGQMMTFLWRAHGSPKATGSNPFTDISASDYYYDAVLWAVKNGITSGTSATTFAPNAAVTRSQAVTFQWRAAGFPTASESSFADVAADTWYADAVAWAVSNGITSGIGGNNFGPDVAVSRAQAVTFLYREQE